MFFSLLITPKDNVFLIGPPSLEGVTEIIKSLNSWKPQGCDEFLTEFFISFWHIIGEHIVKLI